jgi:hypothetical protein
MNAGNVTVKGEGVKETSPSAIIDGASLSWALIIEMP